MSDYYYELSDEAVEKQYLPSKSGFLRSLAMILILIGILRICTPFILPSSAEHVAERADFSLSWPDFVGDMSKFIAFAAKGGESQHSDPNHNSQETIPEGDINPTETGAAETEEPTEDVTQESTVVDTGQDTVWDGFHYGLLNEEEKGVYDVLANTVANFETESSGIKITDPDSLQTICNALYRDHPNLMHYLDRWNFTQVHIDNFYDIKIEPEYICSKEEMLERESFVEQATAGFLKETDHLTDYEKVKAVYEYLIDTTKYDDAYVGTGVYELLHDHRAVCAGYAQTAQYLLDRMGIECIYVTGIANNGMRQDRHAWNLVRLDGEYYQMDVTWGDPVAQDGTARKTFSYLNVTDEEMMQTHFYDLDVYPECTATEYNYFRAEGKYFDSIDPDQISNLCQDAIDEGKNTVQIKMSSPELLEQIADLLQNRKIPNFLQTYRYTIYEKMCVICLQF